jgi:hypothetical protein
MGVEAARSIKEFNGGGYGLEDFEDAFQRSQGLVPDDLWRRPRNPYPGSAP